MDDLIERKYLIRKQGFYYRPGCSGYTDSAIEAGRYTLDEAERYTHPNGKDGPRDGMTYLHEDAVTCPSWLKYKEAADALTALQSENAKLRAELARRDANENRNCINWGPCSRHDRSMADDDPDSETGCADDRSPLGYAIRALKEPTP